MPLNKGDRRPCSVYRWYAATGQLLYVGAALDPNRRWAQLRTAEDWPQFAVRRTVEWHPTVREALAAETAAIRSEDPLLNLDGRGERSKYGERRSLTLADGTVVPFYRDVDRWLVGYPAIAERYEYSQRFYLSVGRPRQHVTPELDEALAAELEAAGFAAEAERILDLAIAHEELAAA